MLSIKMIATLADAAKAIAETLEGEGSKHAIISKKKSRLRISGLYEKFAALKVIVKDEPRKVAFFVHMEGVARRV